jgi:hypothetical protein
LSKLLQKSYFNGFRLRLAKGGNSRCTKKNNEQSKNSARIFCMSPSNTFGGLEQRTLRPHLARPRTVPIEAPTIQFHRSNFTDPISPIQFIDTTCCMS